MHADYLEIRKNFLSHAMPKGYQGMPSDIRKAGPAGMKKKADDRAINNSRYIQKVKTVIGNVIDVFDRYRAKKISYDTAKSLVDSNINMIDKLGDKVNNAGWDSIDGLFGNMSEKESYMRLGFSEQEVNKFLAAWEELHRGSGKQSFGSKAGMPTNVPRRR